MTSELVCVSHVEEENSRFVCFLTNFGDGESIQGQTEKSICIKKKIFKNESNLK